MGRPPLTEDEVRDKVLAYCTRYGVAPGPEGLPPFPSGKRESRQHREWLTVYRAHRRSRRRAAAADAVSSVAELAPGRVPREAGGASVCPVCALVVGAQDGVRVEASGRPPRSAALFHPTCADLARQLEKAGPDAAARLTAWLWSRRRGRRPGP